MAESVLLINPTPPRNSKGRFVKGSRHRNPANPKRRRRRHNPVAALAANPKRRRRRNPVAALNPHRRRRRNPIGGDFMRQLMPAVWGGAGAIVVNAGANFLPLPAQLKTGWGKYLTNAALAIALGTFGRRILGANATTMANGSLVVTAYDALREVARGAGLNLGDLGYNVGPLPQYYPGQWSYPLAGMGEDAPQLEDLSNPSFAGDMSNIGQTEYLEAY